jgi:hypothetical protein
MYIAVYSSCAAVQPDSSGLLASGLQSGLRIHPPEVISAADAELAAVHAVRPCMPITFSSHASHCVHMCDGPHAPAG